MVHLKHPRDKIYDENFLDVCDPKIAGFYKEYCIRKNGRHMPCRRDFDPIDMKEFLSGITLVEKCPDRGEFIYRLAGTEAVELRKVDPTGKLVKDYFHGDSWEEVEENYNYVCDHRAFIYDHTIDKEKMDLYFHEEVIFLPLSDNDQDVNMIMLFSVKRLDKSQLR